MKVKELIAALEKCLPNADVILATDGEGNDFAAIAGVWLDVDTRYEFHNGRMIDVTEDTTIPENEQTAVIWPI
jgi:hypothetical protein